jgi:hypothetical protein
VVQTCTKMDSRSAPAHSKLPAVEDGYHLGVDAIRGIKEQLQVDRQQVRQCSWPQPRTWTWGSPMDGQYVTHIHHMFHTCETCAKHARNVRNALRESRETCARHVRNIVKHRESANHQRISRNTKKHRETCAKNARNVRNALPESRETSRNMRETCAKRRVPRVTYWPSIGIGEGLGMIAEQSPVFRRRVL